MNMNDKVSPDALRKNRVNNSARSLLIGLFTTVLTTMAPFLIRMLMMNYLGEEYVGLNNVLQSIVWILNITELGIGPVMVFFLYQPAAEGKRELVNAYLMEVKKLYRFVAGIILIGGIVILPFLPSLTSEDVPQGENIYILFIGYLIAVVLQYLMWPEMSSILAAFQRLDLQHIVTIITNTVAYALQIVSICLLHNFMLYILSVVMQAILAGILQMVFGRCFFKGYYPQGMLKEKQKKEVKKRIISMFGHQMDEKILGSVDNLFVSSILGLRMVAIYGNYIYVVTAVSMLINTVYNAVLSSIGNAIAIESRESNMIRFDCMFFLSNLLAGWSTVCMLCLYQSFMNIWMPGHLLPAKTMVLFCIFSYMTQMRRSVQTFKNAGGMWYNDRYKPYIAMLVDLILDYYLISLVGVEGAILATIICVGVIEFPWEVHVLYRDYFQRSAKEYAKRFIIYTLLNIVLCTVVYFLAGFIFVNEGIYGLIMNAVISTLFCVLFYFAVYRNNGMMRIWVGTIRQMLKGS